MLGAFSQARKDFNQGCNILKYVLKTIVQAALCGVDNEGAGRQGD